MPDGGALMAEAMEKMCAGERGDDHREPVQCGLPEGAREDEDLREWCARQRLAIAKPSGTPRGALYSGTTSFFSYRRLFSF